MSQVDDDSLWEIDQEPLTFFPWVPSRTGATIAGTLLILVGIVNACVVSSFQYSVLGYLPGVNIPNIISLFPGYQAWFSYTLLSGWVASIAWVGLGCILVFVAPKRLDVAIITGFILSLVLLVEPAVEYASGLPAYMHFGYNFASLAVVCNVVVPWLVTIAIGLAIWPSRHPQYSRGWKVASVCLLFFALVGALFQTVWDGTHTGYAIHPEQYVRLVLFPLTAMFLFIVGWIVLISTIKLRP